MFEKVNPCHPDKIADRIAGAIVDYAYSCAENPKIAVEVLIGHGECLIIAESSVNVPNEKVNEIVKRIAGDDVCVRFKLVPQDTHLAHNQKDEIRCGDNGIFRGMPITEEQKKLSEFSRNLFDAYPYDGKFILKNNELIVCQSNAGNEILMQDIEKLGDWKSVVVNPLGEWTGGINVDSGATNRKLGSDMGDAVTGGGLHGKDLSKADVSVNIFAHLLAQERQEPVEMSCAIGAKGINGFPYEYIVKTAKEYIHKIGGFERFAEWGLI